MRRLEYILLYNNDNNPCIWSLRLSGGQSGSDRRHGQRGKFSGVTRRRAKSGQGGGNQYVDGREVIKH